MSHDLGRQYDLLDLSSRLKHAVGSEKLAIEKAIYNICQESGLVRSMRERLIKEMRDGNSANVRDINEFIKNKSRYNQVVE